MGRSIRKLRRGGDIEGLLEVARDEPSLRVEALTAILELADEHPQVIRDARADVLGAVRGWVTDPDPQVRASGLGLVILLRDEGARSSVTRALRDDDPKVRARALLGVFHLRPPGCLGDVVRLLDDPDAFVRSLAVAALEGVADNTSAELLAERRERETDPVVRERIDEVLQILAGHRPPTPIEPFLGGT